MSPDRSSLSHRALLIAVLSVLLMAPLALWQPTGLGQSVTQCVTEDSNVNEGGILKSPLWVGDVTIRSIGQGNDPDSVFPEGTVAFVNPDDDIQVKFTIVNRIPDGATPETAQASAACQTLQQQLQPMNALKIRFRYAESDLAAENANWAAVPGVNCLGDLDEYNKFCAVTDEVEIAPGPGEHRLLYVIGNQPAGQAFTALLGIERVVIVERRPDISATAIEWVSPPEAQRVTTYGVEALSDFRLSLTNPGDYPYWNPNGGLDYCGWPSFDGNDADNLADGLDATKECDYQSDFPLLPFCNADVFWGNGHTGGAPDTADLVCSYKFGYPLRMPVGYRVTRTGDGVVTDTGVHPTETFWGSPEDQNNDKSEAIVPGAAQPTQFIMTMFDRNRKAGEFDFEFNVGQGVTPNADDSLNNNLIDEKFDVFGVDLRWAEHSVQVESDPGCGLSVETACPAGAKIVVRRAKFSNEGDAEADDDAGVLNRDFKAAIFLNGDRKDVKEFFAPLPKTTDDPKTVWDGIEIETDAEGGTHTIELRLDHLDNYAGDLPPVNDPTGQVAEKLERNRCPIVGEEEDNVFCLTLIFEDESAPIIGDLGVITVDGEDVEEDPAQPGLFLLDEGVDYEFEAVVDDNSIDTVTALFTYPNGTVQELPMEENGGDDEIEGRYTVTTSFSGELGEYIFKVKALDTTANEGISETGLDFKIVELPKDITVTDLWINGGTDFLTPENIPEYQGTAAAPENTFRLVATIAEDGHPPDPTPPFEAPGKVVRFYDAADRFRFEVPMGAVTECDVYSAITHEPVDPPETATGTQCYAPNGLGPLREPANLRAKYIVDNDCDQPPEEEGGGTCGDVPADLQTLWAEQVKIAWVGSFDIGTKVTDINNRSRELNKTGALRDVGDPLEINDAVIAPTAVDPGQEISASADVSDGLFVERVFLRVTKPDGTVAEFDLPDKPLDDETQSGTWSGTFGSGVGQEFDQATTAAQPYRVEMVATDFALTEESTALPDVTVRDIDPPLLLQFETIPPEVQEEGGFVTWEAKVSDSTAIKTPKLTVTRPNVGTQTFDMVYHEDTGRWNYTLDAEPTTLGTWNYNLNVEDWAGHAVTGTGTIRIVTNLAPQAFNWKPAVQGTGDKLYGPAAPTIEVDILDFGGGVDPASIEMTLNNQAVVFERRTVANGFHLVHTVRESQAFDDGATVTVKVEAADLSVPPLVAEALTHQFVVDAKAPTGTFEATPSLFRQGQRIVGANSDIEVAAADAASGPGEVLVVVQHLGNEPTPVRQTLTYQKTGAFRLDDLDEAFRGHGSYQVVVTPSDAVGNKGAELRQNVLFDAAPPAVVLIQLPGKPAEFIAANITDASRVEKAAVKYRADGGDQQTLALTRDDGLWQGTIVDQENGQPFPKGTTISYVIEAEDFFGNAGSNLEKSFRAGDVVPTIVITAPEDGDTIEGTVAVTWTASDLETAASALKISLYYSKDVDRSCEITQGEDPLVPIADAQALSNVGRYNLDTTQLPNGQVLLEALVWDGNLFGCDTVRLTLRNLNKLFTNPAIEPTDPRPGQDVTFSVLVDGDVRKAWANVTKDGELVTAVPLTDSGGGVWKGSFKAPEEGGVYQVNLEALTAEGPVKSPAAYTFTVQSAGQDGKGYVAEWVILSILFAAALAVGVVGIVQRWK